MPPESERSPSVFGAPATAEASPVDPAGPPPRMAGLFQNLSLLLGLIAFLYFARPVVLPIVLACVGAMMLKPVIRRLSDWHIRPAFAAALVLGLLVAIISIGFLQLGRPAMAWMNDAPEHLSQLRQRVQRISPRLARISQAADAVNNLGASDAEQKGARTVELKTSRVPDSFINWTGTFLAGVGETLVLLYLLLASGDLFLQKLVRVMPTFSDKKRAVEISHEIQQNISHYLFTVTLINLGLGFIATLGLYELNVPNAPMWGGLMAYPGERERVRDQVRAARDSGCDGVILFAYDPVLRDVIDIFASEADR